MERELQKLNWLTVQQLVPEQIDTLILPVGTIEAHGAACLGTDNYIPEAIAHDIAERLNALVAPTVAHGVTRSLIRYPGGTTIRPDIFSAYIHDILESCDQIGFRNLIVMNGHGGNNEPLKSMAFEFHRSHKSRIAVIHWWQLCQRMTDEYFGHVGGHAGTDEQAMVQAIDPSLATNDMHANDLAWHLQPGADVYPVPGSILLYRKDEGYPEFDEARSREYRTKVAEAVGDFCEMVIKRWDTFDL